MKELINAIVIDDVESELFAITKAFSSSGISSLPIHYQNPTEAYTLCEKAAGASPRIIITDIQMNDAGKIPSKSDLTNVAKCLIKILEQTSGPYAVLAWSDGPENFKILKDRVENVFEKENIRKPVYFDCIDKSECKVGANFSTEKILEKLSIHFNEQKQLRALLHWEKSVLQAAIESVNQLIDNSNGPIANTLYALASKVAGANMSGNEAIAINESLAYVLRDKLSYLASNSGDIWKMALEACSKKPIIPETQKALLNTILHIDFNLDDEIICPGDVWKLENPELVFKLITQEGEATNLISSFKEDLISCDLPKELKKDLLKNSEIIAIEISPVCDFTNDKKKVKNLVLGLLILKNGITDKKSYFKSSESLNSCPIQLRGKDYVMAISAKYSLSFADKKLINEKDQLKLKKIFRVRDSLLQSWVHKIASYNSRIGTISF